MTPAPGAAAEIATDYGLADLTAPLDGPEGPAGPWLRYEPLYERIRDARKGDDPTLPRGVWERELKKSDWSAVRALCVEALRDKTKDLQLAVWLAEAWLRQDGYRGLAAGVALWAALTERFWEGLHPELDEDGDAEMRVGPLAWANREFPVLIRLAPLTRPALPDTPAHSLFEWEEIGRIESLASRDSDAAAELARGKPDRQALDTGLLQTPVAALGRRLGEIDAALAALERLDAFLDGACPKAAPSLGGIREVLSAARERVARWIDARGGLAEPAEDARDPADTDETPEPESPREDAMRDEASQEAETPTGGGGPIRGRRDAYRRLEEVADYLMRTEPHSPVPYLIKRAVAWGNMSFGDLMMELMAEDGDKRRLLKLLGLDKARPPGGDADG